MRLPRLSEKEHLILSMLLEAGEMYGLQMVKASRGDLKRGTVYVTLARMEQKGYVVSSAEQANGVKGAPRRLYRVTGHGRTVHEAWQLAGRQLAGL